MSSPTPPSGLPSEGLPERHETADGTVYWGDIPQERFEKAAERWPVLKYVVEEYFHSPERTSKDAKFLARYESVGEDSAEFNGFQDDLDDAIKQYSLAAALINGLMGISLSSSDVRTLLASLKDQVLQQGEYDPNPDADDDSKTDEKDGDDPFGVNSASERVAASFFWKREIPFGPLKGRQFPLVAYFGAAVGCILVGLLISFIPFVGGLGSILMLVGGIICFVLAVGILDLRKDAMEPERAKKREEAKKEIEEKKKDRGGKGFFARKNPFSS